MSIDWESIDRNVMAGCEAYKATSGDAAPEERANVGRCAVSTGSVAARLTPEQIKNWRNILCGMIGPYALIMPDADVQRLRDQMQAKMGGPQNIQSEPTAATAPKAL